MIKFFKNKKIKKTASIFLASCLGLSGISVLTSIKANPSHGLVNHPQKSNQAAKDIIEFDDFFRVSKPVTERGPIVYDKNNFYLLDWFGQPIWKADLKQALLSKGFAKGNGVHSSSFFPGAFWSNFAYSRFTKKLYILTLATEVGAWRKEGATNNYQYQYIVPINIETGEIELTTPENTPRIDVTGSTGYWGYIDSQNTKISVLSNNNFAIYNLYGTTGIGNGGAATYIFNPILNQIVKKTAILNVGFYDRINGLNTTNLWAVNIVPIAEDRNLVFLLESNGRTGSVYTILANSSLVPVDGQIQVSNPAFEQKTVLKYSIPGGYRDRDNSALSRSNLYGFNDLYAVHPISGVIQVFIYDTMFFITPNSEEPNGYTFETLQLPKVKSNSSDVPYETGIMYSGYFDLLGDFYFNMATWNRSISDWDVDTKIYLLNQTPESGRQINVFTDLLSSDNPDIENHVNKFRIIPLPTQIGKIMLLNNQTGIAVAIVRDEKNRNFGEILGTLNGEYNFLGTPGFSLNEGANFLVPSQLNRSNLKINGNGLVQSLEVSEINDQQGTITINAVINYLPWFESAGSPNIQVTNVTNTFTDLTKIQSISNWANDLDYLSEAPKNFVTIEKVSEINPFRSIQESLNYIVEDQTQYTIINPNQTPVDEVMLGYSLSYKPNLDQNGPLQTYRPENKTYKVLDIAKEDYKLQLFEGSSISKAGKEIFNKEGVVDIKNFVRFEHFVKNKYLASDVVFKEANFVKDFFNIEQTVAYIIEDLDVKLIADDTEGTLEVIVNVTQEMNEKLGLTDIEDQEIKTTYANFVKTSDLALDLSKFSSTQAQSSVFIVELENLIDDTQKTAYKNLLASEVTLQNVVEDFLAFSGFNFNQALKIELETDDANGILKVFVSKNPAYTTNLSGLALFEGSDNSIVEIKISGFIQTSLNNNQEREVSFVKKNDPNLLKLFHNNLVSSQVSKQDALTLVNLGPKLQEAGFKLEEENIELFANPDTGELSVLVDLNKENNKTLVNAIPDKATFPTSFGYTFSGFPILVKGNYVFLIAKQSQLSKDLDLTQITPEYILANKNQFILSNVGYTLNSVDQIKVIVSDFAKLYFIKFDFSEDSSLPNEINKEFGVFYSAKN